MDTSFPGWSEDDGRAVDPVHGLRLPGPLDERPSLFAPHMRVLKAQLGKVQDAVAALGGVAREYKVRQGIRKAKTVVRNVRS